MNPIPEPDELLESECNAQGLYGLPAGAFAQRRETAPAPARDARTLEPDARTLEPDATGGRTEEPRNSEEPRHD